MLGGALGQYPLGGGPTGTISVTTIGWYSELSSPVKYLVQPAAAIALNNQVFAFNPLPLVSFGWFGNLSEPVRPKPISPAAIFPNYFFDPAVSPFVATGWYNWLSEPVRSLPGLLAPSQKDFATDPTFIPSPSKLLEGWYNWLSEPKRFLPGLGAESQKAYLSPDRLLPTPTVTVNFISTEINSDVAAIVVFTRPVVSSKTPNTVQVSITELISGGATSVIESS